MKDVNIAPYRSSYREAVIDLSLKAWEPVFAKTINEVPRFVYDNFWPRGWRTRQASEISALLEAEPENFSVALEGDLLVGFVGVAIHPEDQMGEVVIIAVSPSHQRKSLGKALITHAEQQIRDAGMEMVMVETVGDSGHEPARRTYEAQGYEPWPVARYFKKL